MRNSRFLLLISTGLCLPGCYSPFHTDRGALYGGLLGAGLGAAVGGAVGDPLAGAVIGAGAGTVTGAAVGSSLDEMEARNRAEIEARLGRPVAVGAVTPDEVIAMTQAGVDEQIIVNHIQIHGGPPVLNTNDIIRLQSSGVSPRVVQALQLPPMRPLGTSAPPPVIIQEHYHAPTWRRPWRPGPPHPFGW